MTDRPKTVATYDQRCSACDDPIHEGDVIALNDDGDWVHEDCADE
jgi:hypothetical protein